MSMMQGSRENAVVKRVRFDHYKRVIVTSDIHGDKDGLAGMLQQVHFSHEDGLVLVGDLIERGAHSLELLRMVLQYAKAGNVYAVEGNNDAVFIDWYAGRISDEDICRYVNGRKNSLILDMAMELEMKYETVEDIKRLKAVLGEAFREEIEFLQSLPQVIESELAVFVHAGIRPGDLRKQDPEYCMTAPEFGRQPYCFKKTVVVGHWPVSNYSDCVISVNPYWNHKSNVISIDGGNSMKRWQQINYLIFEKGTIQFGYYDQLPKIHALDSQEESQEPFTLLFPHTRIDSMREMREGNYCVFSSLNKELLIAKDRIYRYKGTYYCYDFTTYCLPVRAGERLSYCGKEGAGILVKRDGIVGNYYGRYELLHDL